MRVLRLGRQSQNIFATRRGWFEPAVRPGDAIEAGDVAGWYHDLERLEDAEEALPFAEGGIVIAQRLHSHCEAGDCLMQVAALVEDGAGAPIGAP